MNRYQNYLPTEFAGSILFAQHNAQDLSDRLDEFYKTSGGFTKVKFFCDRFNEFCIYLSAVGCLVVNLLD